MSPSFKPSPVVALSSVVFLFFIAMAMRVPLIPLFVQQQGASIVEVGFIAASFMLVAAIAGTPIGIISDRIGRGKLIIMGCIISAVSSFVIAYSQSLMQTALAYTVAGLSAAFFEPPITAMVGDVSRAERAGRTYGLFTTFLTIGWALGPAVGGGIADVFGFRESFVASGVIMAAGTVLAVVVLSRIHVPPTSKSSKFNVARDFRELRGDLRILTSWLAIFSVFFTSGSIQVFLPLYTRGLGFNMTLIGLLFTCQAVSNGIGRIPIGTLFDRTRNGIPFLVFGLIGIGVLTFFLPVFTSFIILLAPMAASGVFIGTINLAAQALLGKTSRKETRGFAFGFTTLCRQGGMATGSPVVGLTVAAYGFPPGFIVAGSISLLGALTIQSLAKWKSNAETAQR